ncbi:MAG: DUF4870 domain-containing protein [Anaerolineales bacterium]|nr:DUF4870 domain-containing protein [Anaerolineales bacterium]
MMAETVLPPSEAVTAPTQDERNWAMLAHLSALLTVGVVASTGGVGYVVALLAPLGLYLYFAGQSRYVAYHALQATVFQALAGIGYVLLVGAVGAAIAAAWVVAGVLSVVLIGLLLLPLALGFTLLAVLELLALPLLALFYALRGAYLTAQGEPFAYPLIGALVGHSLGQPA